MLAKLYALLPGFIPGRSQISGNYSQIMTLYKTHSMTQNRGKCHTRFPQCLRRIFFLGGGGRGFQNSLAGSGIGGNPIGTFCHSDPFAFSLFWFTNRPLSTPSPELKITVHLAIPLRVPDTRWFLRSVGFRRFWPAQSRVLGPGYGSGGPYRVCECLISSGSEWNASHFLRISCPGPIRSDRDLRQQIW